MSIEVVYTDRDTIIVISDDLSTEVPLSARSLSVASTLGGSNAPPDQRRNETEEPQSKPSTPSPPMGDPTRDGPKYWPRPKEGPGVMIVRPRHDADQPTEDLFSLHTKDVEHLYTDLEQLRALQRGAGLHALRTVATRIRGTPGSALTVLDVNVPEADMKNGFNISTFGSLFDENSAGLDGIRFMSGKIDYESF